MMYYAHACMHPRARLYTQHHILRAFPPPALYMNGDLITDENGFATKADLAYALQRSGISGALVSPNSPLLSAAGEGVRRFVWSGFLRWGMVGAWWNRMYAEQV